MNFMKRKQSIVFVGLVVVLLFAYVHTAYNPYVEQIVNDNTVERLADVNPEEIITADKSQRMEKTLEKAFEFGLNEFLHYANENRDAGDEPLDLETIEQKVLSAEDTENLVDETDVNSIISEDEDIQEIVRYEFRNDELLSEHFEKHGAEFPYETELDYLIGANLMLENPNKLHKTEKEDGDDVYYIEATNEFLILSKDGYIRTYFKPSKGKAYFDRQ